METLVKTDLASSVDGRSTTVVPPPGRESSPEVAEEKRRRRCSVDDEDEDADDDRSDGTLSDVDMSSDAGDVNEERRQDQSGHGEAADDRRPVVDASASSRAQVGRQSLGVSQYHSIQQLSSPAITGQTPRLPSGTGFCSQLLDFSSTSTDQLFRRGGPEAERADSVRMLRGMMGRPEVGSFGQSSFRPTTGDQHNYDQEDEDEWAQLNETGNASTDGFMSDDGDAASPRNSVDFSTNASGASSSADEMSDGYRDGRATKTGTVDADAESQEKKSRRGDNGAASASGTGSDVGGEGFDAVEAKRARMESIVTSMRPKSSLSTVAPTAPECHVATGSTGNGNLQSPGMTSGISAEEAKRRPKRKQYIPKQHESSAMTSGIDGPEVGCCDRPEDMSIGSGRKSSMYSSEREELEAELSRMSEQLTEIKQKYAKIFGIDDGLHHRIHSSVNNYTLGGNLFGGHFGWSLRHGERDKLYGGQPRSGKSSTDRLGKCDNDCKLGGGAGGSDTYHGQSSPLGGDTPGDIEKLVEMLKAEIATGVGSLVDEIVKNFVEKYRLASPAVGSALDRDIDVTDGPTCKADQRDKSPSGPAASKASPSEDAEDLSKDGGDKDDVDDDEEDDVNSTPRGLHPVAPASNFLPLAGLLMPGGLRGPEIGCGPDMLRSTSGSTAMDERRHSSSTSSTAARSLFDHHQLNHLHVGGPTAFDLPTRSTSHHPLGYPLFAPHAYYPSRLMSAAAAAAAAAAATGALYPSPSTPSSAAAPAAMASATSSMFGCREPEQTEALPLVVNAPTKKKRTKVTDTRLSPRAARNMLQDQSSHRSHHGSSYQNGRPEHHHHAHHHHHQQPINGASGSSFGAVRSDSTPISGSGQQNDDDADRRRSPSARSVGGPSTQVTPDPLPGPPYLSRVASGLPLMPASLPTSVAVPNPSLQHSDIMHAIFQFSQQRMQQQQQPFDALSASQRFGGSFGERYDVKPSLHRDDESSDGRKADSAAASDAPYDQMVYEDGLTSTLTPMHLRKAKLMFFYVRYPSSAILKVYFPDVRFNKNNTAQLIKWFSNFREFYYIQMEKYARQAIAEGVKNASDLFVSTESELYRVLVLHYNRNNQIEVPESFRSTVQATLREFFKSIQAEKDQEQSWKKAIYKIIARLDDTVPEYFKSSNWLQQLADG